MTDTPTTDPSFDPALATRVEALETMVAHQQRQMDDLSEALALAWREREGLRRDLERLRDEMSEASPGENVPIERPPHW